MEKALAKADLRGPLVPLYANVTAAPVADPSAIRVPLVEQVTGTVRWRESVDGHGGGRGDRVRRDSAPQGAPGLVKRIAPEASATPGIGTPADVAAFAL